MPDAERDRPYTDEFYLLFIAFGCHHLYSFDSADFFQSNERTA
jgi:hypothetical protein